MGIIMKLKHILFALSALTSLLSYADIYFYCITENNRVYEFYPITTVNFNVIGSYLREGQPLDHNLGEYYGHYEVNAKDISGGKFKSKIGTPYAYFIFPRKAEHRNELNKLVKDLRDQCQDFIGLSNIAGEQFAQIRISNTRLEYAKVFGGYPGYPAVYLNLKQNNENEFAPEEGEQNIMRIAD